MIENTIIKDTLDRAFSGLELMLGCKTTTKTKCKSKTKKKSCGSRKCKTSGFVPHPTNPIKKTKKND